MAQMTKASMKRKAEKNPQYVIMGTFVGFLFIMWMLSSSEPAIQTSVLSTELQAREQGQKSGVELKAGTIEGILLAPESNRIDESAYTFRYADPDTVLFHHNSKAATSGMIIKDMVLAHAYSYKMGETYGGSCGDRTNKFINHESLIESLGLGQQLQFSCPRDHDEEDNVRRRIVPDSTYQGDDTALFTPEYVSYLRSLAIYPPKQAGYTIAVHIRRGKDLASPCSKKKKQGYFNYLPNSHYQRLIDLYNRQGARVLIFSSGEPLESLSEFADKGYELNVDGELSDAWKTMATADVLILSRSTLPLVPALLNRGRVVYTPFVHNPLPGWDVVGDTLLELANTDLAELRVKFECK